MPILIRELSIKITVDDQQNQRGTSSSDSSAISDQDSKHEIIAECVEQVMDILKAKIEK